MRTFIHKQKPAQHTRTVRPSPHSRLSSSQSQAVRSILHLQRATGKQSVQVQPKLKVNRQGDIYEQEADRVAEHVMRMPDSTVQRQAEEEKQIRSRPLASTITPLIQRQPEPEEEEEVLESVPTRDAGELGDQEELTPPLESLPTRDAGELGDEEELTPPLESVPTWDEVETEQEEEEEPIQTKSNINTAPQVTAGIAHDINSLKGTGKPLTASERAFFEPRFGVDFGNVRVHTNERAARTAQHINARAFTLGHDIVFGAGQYSPASYSGKSLLAHELTHVVQQNGRRSFGPHSEGLKRHGLVQGEVFSHRPDNPGDSRIIRLNFIQKKNQSTQARRMPVIARAPNESIQRKLTDEQLARAHQPGTLACIVLCYLGIPSNLWRKIVVKVLTVASESFELAYGQAKGRQAYRRWQLAFKPYNVLSIGKIALEIAVLGKIAWGTVPVPSRLRKAVLKLFLSTGVRAVTLTTAMKIVSKLALYIEIAWIAGCTGYCALTKYMREMYKGIKIAAGIIRRLTAVSRGVTWVGQQYARGIAQLFIQLKLTVNSHNWGSGGILPLLLGKTIYKHLSPGDPDRFFSLVGQPLNRLKLPASVYRALPMLLGGRISTRSALRMTPIKLAKTLASLGIIWFRKDPRREAARMMKRARVRIVRPGGS